MSRLSLWNYAKTASDKLAKYTGYVHLITFLAIWLGLMSFLGFASLSMKARFFVATFLGAVIAICFGALFWLLPSLIVRWKKRRGKN